MKELLDRIYAIHIECHKLCYKGVKSHLPVAGNVGVFCQIEEEYERFKEIQDRLVHNSENISQKYFELREPVFIEKKNNIPSATYTHLYIRKPDPTPYGKNKGDIDFIMGKEKYEIFKAKVLAGNAPDGIEIYDRTGWDTVQITDPHINSVAYISTKEFSEKVRIKFD